MGTRETKIETLISPPPPWIELPGDVTANILQRLSAEEILKSAGKVCSTWSNVCRRHPTMWRVVQLENKPVGGDEREFDLMCRCAVDRSPGQLIDLTISRFGGDELLNYVGDRSGHLRRLAVEYTKTITACALTELLEELHLFHSLPKLAAEDVETIGISCPLLKSFEHSEDGIALAIAKTMPNLHHLRLSGNMMNNAGSDAILDGCSHRESLHISGCWGLNLQVGSTLGQRCSKQIKYVVFPFNEHDYLNSIYTDRDFLDYLLDLCE